VNVLLTRLDRVGDLILSTPAIASARRSWPDAHITLVCSAYNAVVVERNPDVDRVVVKPNAESPAAFGRRFRGGTDLAIALAPCAPDFHLVGATRAPVRVGYTYVRRYLARLSAPLYVTKLGISEADPALCERRPDHRVRHEVEQVNDLISLAGGSTIVPDLVVPVDDADRRAVDHVPGGGIAVHLGLRWFAEGSTLESTIRLIGELRTFGLPVVATYGVDALDGVAAIRAAGVADAVVGGLSFSQWAAVFEKSRMVVTVDTGATHVASAMRRPTVVLFEHRYFHLSSQEWSPYRVPSICLRKPATSGEGDLSASRAAIVSAVATLLERSSVPTTRR
jgi:ADP-heptose:LPS heptosyltransferase